MRANPKNTYLEDIAMYIGSLLAAEAGLYPVIKTYKRGTTVEMPSTSETGYAWKWEMIHDQGVDFAVQFGKTVYVDSVLMEQTKGSSVLSASVLVDGNPVGKITAKPGELFSGCLLNIPVGVFCDQMIVRLDGDFAPISIQSMEIPGSIEEGPVVFPIPEKMTLGEAVMKLSDLKGITLEKRSKDIVFAAKHLSERLKESLDVKMRTAQEGLFVHLNLDKKIGKECYRVDISQEGATLMGGSRASLLWAVETFVQLVKDGNLYACSIEDKPYRPFRGVHILLPAREQIPFYKRLIRSMLVSLRYNILYLNIAGGMRFQSHPEITEAWIKVNERANKGELPKLPFGTCGGGSVLEQEEVRDLVEYAREYGIETIPEIQSLSHVQYITIAHPDIAEVDESVVNVKMDTRDTDQPATVLYKHSYCPSNPKSYEIIFDLIDEIVEVCRPKEYVHMGHDELYQMNLCPLCKDKEPAALLAKHIIAVHDKLKSKGLKMMMWADMLQPGSILYYSKGPEVIHMLPKDIVMLDFVWYYRFEMDLEDRLLEASYKVMMGNLYASHYPRFESRIAKPNMIGGECSFWVETNEYQVARVGKLYDLFMVANMLWSSHYSSKNKYTYDRIVWGLTPDMRQRVRGVAAPSLHGKKSYPVKLNGKSNLPLELALSIPQGKQTLRGIQFHLNGAWALNSGVEIKVDSKCASLVFLHTATGHEKRDPWAELVNMGSYEVVYEDGTTEDVWIKYGGNVHVWNRRYGQPKPNRLFRHTGYTSTWFADPMFVGKTPFGSNVVLYGQEWVNPHADKKIKAIRLHGVQDVEGDVVLNGLSIVK